MSKGSPMAEAAGLDWAPAAAANSPPSKQQFHHPLPKPKEQERARSRAQPLPPAQILGYLCPSQENAPQLSQYGQLLSCPSSVVTAVVSLKYWSLSFLSSKNGSKFPKRNKRTPVSRGAVLIVFAVWNEACPCGTMLRMTCTKQYESCSLLRIVWNFAPVRDEKQKVFNCEEAKDCKRIMEDGPWMYSFGSSFCHDVVIIPLRGKYSQAFNSSWKNNSSREDQREMTGW